MDTGFIGQRGYPEILVLTWSQPSSHMRSKKWPKCAQCPQLRRVGRDCFETIPTVAPPSHGEGLNLCLKNVYPKSTLLWGGGRDFWGSREIGEIALTRFIALHRSTPHRKSAKRLYKTKDPSQCDLYEIMKIQCTGASHKRDTSSAFTSCLKPVPELTLLGPDNVSRP